MHYRNVADALDRAEETIKTALRSEMDTETDKKALGEALELVRQAGGGGGSGTLWDIVLLCGDLL